jgi:hypothetical protein
LTLLEMGNDEGAQHLIGNNLTCVAYLWALWVCARHWHIEGQPRILEKSGCWQRIAKWFWKLESSLPYIHTLWGTSGPALYWRKQCSYSNSFWRIGCTCNRNCYKRVHDQHCEIVANLCLQRASLYTEWHSKQNVSDWDKGQYQIFRLFRLTHSSLDK